MPSKSILFILILLIASCGGTKPAQQANTAPSTPVIAVVPVISQEFSRQLHIPAELQAFEDVPLFARVPGYVESVTVDRGSVVRKGQLLIRLKAAELDTQKAEAEARVRIVQAQKNEAATRVASLKAQVIEAQTRVESDEGTYNRMKAASATPGAVAGNDLDVARHTLDASRARLRVWEENARTAEAQVKALDENEKALKEAARSSGTIEEYLKIAAPFDGVIAERNTHPGSLAGSQATGGVALLRIQKVDSLRLLVSVPESAAASVRRGLVIPFTVPARPGESFSGTLQRVGSNLDPKTRTLPVELDVDNRQGKLAPGMVPDVTWPLSRPAPSLFVPGPAVAVTSEKTFVIRIRDGVAEWVDVKRGGSMNQNGVDYVEVFGALNAGDQVAGRGTDEIRNGSKVNVKSGK